MTRARDAATNSHLATYVHPTGSGNNHIPAAEGFPETVNWPVAPS